MPAFFRHVVRAGKVLAKDPTIPRWLRWLLVFGVAPVPLFLDEVALVAAVALLYLFHRATVASAWRETASGERGVRGPTRPAR